MRCNYQLSDITSSPPVGSWPINHTFSISQEINPLCFFITGRAHKATGTTGCEIMQKMLSYTLHNFYFMRPSLLLFIYFFHKWILWCIHFFAVERERERLICIYVRKFVYIMMFVIRDRTCMRASCPGWLGFSSDIHSSQHFLPLLPGGWDIKQKQYKIWVDFSTVPISGGK